MLRYVVHQLHNGQTTEIVVLREIIRHMAGITPLPNLTDSQISAMAGGPVLRTEAVASAARGARLDPSDMALKGPQRLGRALTESQLALPLLIQVAQQRQKCVFHPPSPNAPLKSLGSLYDTVSLAIVMQQQSTSDHILYSVTVSCSNIWTSSLRVL